MNTTTSSKTNGNTTGSTTAAKPNEAKGNKQGQTTLAAKVFRWEALINNVPADIASLPQMKDTLAQFQAVFQVAKGLVDQHRNLRGEARNAVIRRNEVLLQGDELYTRVSLGVQSILGPRSGLLEGVGLKPRKIGRPRKGALVPVPPPLPEAPPAEAAAHAEPQK